MALVNPTNRLNSPVTISGTNGTLNLSAETDGGDVNIFSTNGTQTLAIYGSGSNTLNVSILDGTLTLGNTLIMSDAVNIQLGSTTGTKIGTATTQKLGFYNKAPVVQPGPWTISNGVANHTFNVTGATVSTVANALYTLIQDLQSIGLSG